MNGNIIELNSPRMISAMKSQDSNSVAITAAASQKTRFAASIVDE